jgi:hypothetical protein
MSNETQHTPCEWLTATDGVRSLVAVQGEGVIAVVNQHLPDREANARLIAAAPELLVALEGMLRLMHAVSAKHHELWDECNIARAAIAKATGAA